MKNIYLNLMKTKYFLAIPLALLIGVSSCDKGFVDVNINPISPASIDPVYMLASAETFGTDIHHYEAEICQQMQLLIGGQEEGGNRNTVNFGNMSGRFDGLYGNQIKNTVNVISILKDNPARSNLYNMARIVKAFSFQWLVDTYGDVPYFDAGKAYISSINLPKYDNAELIYDDLVKELTEAVDALDASKDAVPGDLLFAGDIAKWKKFGNSALLRIGMRYTKYNSTKAGTIVAKATDAARGGVMTTNADNVVVKWNATQNNPANGWASNSTKYNWHVGKPLMDFFKTNFDPRAQFLTVRYALPESAAGGTADTVLSHQVGCPFGYSDSQLSAVPSPDPNYPGKLGGAFLYSQFSRQTLGRVDAYLYMLTAAQTQLLMAEARVRGYISTSTAKAYYEAGITLSCTEDDKYSTSRGGASPVTAARITTYLSRPNILFSAVTEKQYEQINTQYWIDCIQCWPEAWFNRERSGYPVLQKIGWTGEDPSVTAGDGFIHRLMYTTREWSANKVNVQAASDRMGGDNFGIRLFWDKKL
jgi:hypothetical protein